MDFKNKCCGPHTLWNKTQCFDTIRRTLAYPLYAIIKQRQKHTDIILNQLKENVRNRYRFFSSKFFFE